ncbi:MAG: hypothetical protein SGBAC_007011 [Bacillariaceae sp.]
MLRLQVYRNPKDDRICTVIGSEAKEAIEKAGWKPVAVSFASTAAQVQSLIDAPDAANGGQAVAIENPDLDEELLNALMNTSETDEERKQKLNDLVIRGASIERSLSMIRAASDTNNGAKNMKALLDLGGSVQDCDKYGSTPLHIAAFFCNAEVAEILLENGADIEAKDNDGETPTLVLEKTIQRNLDMELGFGTEMPPEERQRQDKIKELERVIGYNILPWMQDDEPTTTMGDVPDDRLVGDEPDATVLQPRPKKKREKRKIANQARHRLQSIWKDANSIQDVIKPLMADAGFTNDGWPWIANEQCGSCISLKRLGLPLLKVLRDHEGCVLVDSSVRKLLPDSFSRTIPIWACVINRIAKRYREELGMGTSGYSNDNDWDVGLHTPASIVSPEEHATLSDLIDSRVDLLYQSKAIVDPRGFVTLLTKPIRACWWSNERCHEDTVLGGVKEQLGLDKYHVIVCCNPSMYIEDDKPGNKNHIQWQGGDDGFYYTPGAADDHETWALGLTPELFWMHQQQLTDLSLTGTQVEDIIGEVVKKGRQDALGDTSLPLPFKKNANKIGETNLWVGSRRAGRPPECWDSFDAILNVTENEYPNMIESIETSQKPCFYLQLVVAEGKRDKTQEGERLYIVLKGKIGRWQWLLLSLHCFAPRSILSDFILGLENGIFNHFGMKKRQALSHRSKTTGYTTIRAFQCH